MGVILMACGGALHIALVCGFITSVFPGFAKADDMRTIAALQKTMLLNGLEKDVFEAREQQCKSGDQIARTLYLQRLNEKLGQYQAVSGGKAPRIPECWEFGVVAAANTAKTQ